MTQNYKTVSIPEELADEVDAIVKLKKRGYRSRAEIFKEAVRTLLDKIKKSDKK